MHLLNKIADSGLVFGPAFLVIVCEVVTLRGDADDFKTLRRVLVPELDEPRGFDFAGRTR